MFATKNVNFCLNNSDRANAIISRIFPDLPLV